MTKEEKEAFEILCDILDDYVSITHWVRRHKDRIEETYQAYSFSLKLIGAELPTPMEAVDSLLIKGGINDYRTRT